MGRDLLRQKHQISTHSLLNTYLQSLDSLTSSYVSDVKSCQATASQLIPLKFQSEFLKLKSVFHTSVKASEFCGNLKAYF